MDLNPALTARLRELQSVYRQLREMPSDKAQQRGQRFNQLIADVFRAFGLEAKANVRGLDGRDEIDVVFTADGVVHVLEAKWEKKRIKGDPVEKLSGRLSDRPAGTRGVVLSMSGYTKPGRQVFERREIVGLEQQHFEATLAGLISPQELLARIHLAQAAKGRRIVPLADVLVLDDEDAGPVPILRSTSETPAPWKVVKSTATGVAASEAYVGAWDDLPALSLAAAPGRLLITTPNGVVEFDPTTGSTRWALALPGTTGRAFRSNDGALTVLCRGALVRWDSTSNDLSVVAGGFGGYATLETDSQGRLWVYNQVGSGETGSTTLACMGQHLGDEQRHEIPFPSGSHVVFLSPDRFFLSGTGHSTILDLAQDPITSKAHWLRSAVQDGRAAVSLGPHTVLTAGNRNGLDGYLVCQDLRTGDTIEELARFTANRLNDIAITSSTALGAKMWILADVQGNDTLFRPLLLDVRVAWATA
ncbi:restriction endonuclease [Streptomyces sp. GXMU-J15]|uniref:Restriction endonuclease n=1 Tax=Streptomyces fuscus TaxID=3048495 RepID=A0ABT7J9B5_9ACTN|nr:restriction endonuclease [Streptomyces fuscus]MDL2081471.1 restriction endonuclease [Streptomyces fuscus]